MKSSFIPTLIMPIYEFYCPDNNTVYQFLARSLAQRDQVPLCPDNPAFPLHKQVSRFAIIGKAKEENSDDPFAGLDDARMEALMAEMEGDLSTFNDDNPDPKQLGRLMRKMSEGMGEKAPSELREMIRRLESGEDPEKLESAFAGETDGAGDNLFTQVRKILRSHRAPHRDPKLYDLSDWVR